MFKKYLFINKYSCRKWKEEIENNNVWKARLDFNKSIINGIFLVIEYIIFS
jgi:hypothetical protein